MAANKIDGKSGDKNQQHGIDDQRSGSWIKTGDQCQPCDKLQERHNDGNQVDEYSREKIIAVNNFCKSSRRQYFVITGIYKDRTQNPAGRQFYPVVIMEGFDEFIQLDNLLIPIPGSRR